MKFIKKQQSWNEVVQKERKGYYASAPGIEDIEFFNSIFKKLVKKGEKILVLGVTPYLREAGIENGCEVTAVDINMAMINKMNDLIKYKNSENEIIIKGDWMNLPIKDHYYDFILGDFSLNNIAPEDHQKILKEMQRLLKKEGYFIIRQRIHLPEAKLYSYSEIADMFRKEKLCWRDFKYFTTYYSKDLPKIYNPKTKKYYWSRYFNLLKKAYDRGELTKEEFESINAEKMNIITIIYPKEEFEILFKKYFDIIEILYCPKLVTSIIGPVYIAKVKK